MAAVSPVRVSGLANRCETASASMGAAFSATPMSSCRIGYDA